MVLEESTAIWVVVELWNTIATHNKTNIPKNLYLIPDDSSDHKVINLYVQTALTALFLTHDMNKWHDIITWRAAGELSYRNPVERVHSIANIAFQSTGLMRQVMDLDKERLTKNINSNEEIWKACEGNEKLKKALA